MSAGEVQICNEALAFLRASPILNFEDGSVESDACKLFYPTARDETLQAYHWDFATIPSATLSPVPDATGAPKEYAWGRETYYLYPLPADCLAVQRTNRDRDIWTVVDDADHGKVLQHDRPENVAIRYTRRVVDTSRYTALFRTALAHKMAAKLAVKLRGKEQLWSGQEQKFVAAIAEAENHTIHQRGFEVLTPSNLFIAGRR